MASEKYAKPKVYMQQITKFHARVHQPCAYAMHISRLEFCNPCVFFSFVGPDSEQTSFLFVGHFLFVYCAMLRAFIERVQTFNNEIECNQAKDIENVNHTEMKATKTDICQKFYHNSTYQPH